MQNGHTENQTIYNNEELKENTRKRYKRCDPIILPNPNNYSPSVFLDLHRRDGEGRLGDRDIGQRSVVLLDVKDGGPIRRVGTMRTSGLGISEGHRGEVGKGRRVTILAEKCDDPLCILATERKDRLDRLGRGLPVGEILDRSVSGRAGIPKNSDSDSVSGRDANFGGEGTRFIGVPLVPSCKKDNIGEVGRECTSQ